MNHTVSRDLAERQHIYNDILNQKAANWDGYSNKRQIKWMKSIEGVMASIIDRSTKLNQLIRFIEEGEMAKEANLLKNMINVDEIDIIDSLYINYLNTFNSKVLMHWHNTCVELIQKNYNLLMGNDIRKFFQELIDQDEKLSNTAIEIINQSLIENIPLIRQQHEYIRGKLSEAEMQKDKIIKLTKSMRPITNRIIEFQKGQTLQLYVKFNVTLDQYKAYFGEMVTKAKDLSEKVIELLVIADEIGDSLGLLEFRQKKYFKDLGWFVHTKDWIVTEWKNLLSKKNQMYQCVNDKCFD